MESGEDFILKLENNFSDLNSLGFSKSTYEERNKSWEEKIKVHHYLPFSNDVKTPSEEFVFRATKMEWTQIVPLERLSYPRKKKYCKEGRCNMKGTPVLYTSKYPKTTLFECNASKGDSFFITSWRINNQSAIKTQHFFFNYKGKIESLKKIRERLESVVRDECKKRGHDYNFHLAILKIIDKNFLGENYSIPSFLSHHYLYESHLSNSIAYPSVAENKEGFNLTFSKKLVDEKILQPNRVIFCDVIDSKPGSITIFPRPFIGTVQNDKMIFEKVDYDFLRHPDSEFRSLIPANIKN